MKKKRLGEILRERNQVSADDLNKAIQDQQGKLVHLGELLLQRGIVSKDNLVSALAEVSPDSVRRLRTPSPLTIPRSV